MSAAVLTAISSLSQIMLRKYQKTIFVKVVIFSFTFKRRLWL